MLSAACVAVMRQVPALVAVKVRVEVPVTEHPVAVPLVTEYVTTPVLLPVALKVGEMLTVYAEPVDAIVVGVIESVAVTVS